MTKPLRVAALLTTAIVCATPAWAAAPAPSEPNILLILMDNLGYGEVGVYGGGATRGAPTPRIDALAGEGVRLTNYNVEYQCTPSRSSLMTGRHAIRSGNQSVPWSQGVYGLVQWEITIAEMLAPKGYVSGHFGKWHLGGTEGRFPTDQGFDEWYGLSHSSDTSLYQTSVGYDENLVPLDHVYAGRKGEPSQYVKVYDLEARRAIDSEITAKTVDFMSRAVKSGKPFFAYVPMTQVHVPTLPNRKFAGKTGNGDWADVLTEMDVNVGTMLDALKKLGVEKNTIVIFTSDNGPEATQPYRGWAGPWRGTYNTAMEGSLRVPFIMRWPGHVPANKVSDEMVQIVDVMPTLADAAGAKMPTDRIIDGIDVLPFLEGKRVESGRDTFVVMVNDRLQAVKWRHWKTQFYRQIDMYDPPLKTAFPEVFDLYSDPQERKDIAITNTWLVYPMLGKVAEFQASLKAEPPIPPGALDPWVPTAAKPVAAGAQ